VAILVLNLKFQRAVTNSRLLEAVRVAGLQIRPFFRFSVFLKGFEEAFGKKMEEKRRK
jgi:hypothetical protein